MCYDLHVNFLKCQMVVAYLSMDFIKKIFICVPKLKESPAVCVMRFSWVHMRGSSHNYAASKWLICCCFIPLCVLLLSTTIEALYSRRHEEALSISWQLITAPAFIHPFLDLAYNWMSVFTFFTLLSCSVKII